MSRIASFRWEFGSPNLIESKYCEVIIVKDRKQHFAQIYLVRDKIFDSETFINPDKRVIERTYIATWVDKFDNDHVEVATKISTEYALRYIYSNIIWPTLKANQNKVREFGDKWLTKLISEKEKK